MTQSMTRWALTGCMASAALGAVAVFDVGFPTAEAAPNVSPFAGRYVQAVPAGPWTFAVSDGGRITGSYSLDYGARAFAKGSLSGSVGADGSYSFSVSESGAYYLDERQRILQRWKSSSTSAGNMASDAVGIVGTTDDGGSFVWLRQ